MFLKIVDYLAVIYKKFHISVGYWYLTSTCIIFLLGQVFSKFEILINFLISLANSTDSIFLKVIFNFFVVYLEFQTPTWIILLVILFMLMNWYLRKQEIEKQVSGEKIIDDISTTKRTTNKIHDFIANSSINLGFHVLRKEESHLLDVLNEKSILLLTGISFSGKSKIAKSLILKQSNFRIYRTDNPFRFLESIKFWLKFASL